MLSHYLNTIISNCCKSGHRSVTQYPAKQFAILLSVKPVVTNIFSYKITCNFLFYCQLVQFQFLVWCPFVVCCNVMYRGEPVHPRAKVTIDTYKSRI